MPTDHSASEDLRIADQYLDKLLVADKNDDLARSTAIKLVQRYIDQARAKDPAATALIKLPHAVTECTADQLQGRLFWVQAVLHNTSKALVTQYTPEGLEHFKKGVTYLEKAIQLLPTPPLFIELAKAYIKTFERAKALELLDVAQNRFPNDFSIRSLRDEIEIKDNLGVPPVVIVIETPPPPKFWTTHEKLFCVALALFVAAPVSYAWSPVLPSMFIIAGMAMLYFAIRWWLDFRRELNALRSEQMSELQ